MANTVLRITVSENWTKGIECDIHTFSTRFYRNSN